MAAKNDAKGRRVPKETLAHAGITSRYYKLVLVNHLLYQPFRVGGSLGEKVGEFERHLPSIG